MRFKSLRIIGVILLSATALTSCGSSNKAADPAAGDGIKIGVITSGLQNDLGWNQGIIDAAKKLETEGLITLTVVEQGYNVTAEDTVRAASDLAEAGNQLVIAHSFNYGEPLKTMIDTYPKVLFAYAGGFGDKTKNLADYSQPFYESAFLAGILAGGVTKTGVLGGTAGFDIPVCHSMLMAFAEGAKLSYKGEVKMIPSYIGSWGDPAKTKEAVLAMVDQGADVSIPCGVEAGTIEGAKATNTGAIGYVMDQSSLAPKNILASIVWNLDEVIRSMVSDVKAGTALPAKYYSLGYQQGGTSVAINKQYPIAIPAETMAIFDEYAAKMKDGSFVVPFIDK